MRTTTTKPPRAQLGRVLRSATRPAPTTATPPRAAWMVSHIYLWSLSTPSNIRQWGNWLLMSPSSSRPDTSLQHSSPHSAASARRGGEYIYLWGSIYQGCVPQPCRQRARGTIRTTKDLDPLSMVGCGFMRRDLLDTHYQQCCFASFPQLRNHPQRKVFLIFWYESG